MAKPNELVMVFDPHTIEHLGVRMYSQVPTAIAELVANAYDADAKNVTVSLYDEGDKRIVVEDDGIGMTFAEINHYFLSIGRNRRVEGPAKTASGRVITGKKGLGKLALFGIGDTIEVVTTKDAETVIFLMNWSDLKETHGRDYKPKILRRGKSTRDSGTIITVSALKRKSPFDVEALAGSLSKHFNLLDNTFRVFVTKNDVSIEVNNDLRYSDLDIEFEFEFPEYSAHIEEDYANKKDISGLIITTEKPLAPGLRGITLFANGRLVNAPEFFGRSVSSHFYSYVTGSLDVDFVDNWKEDMISTNRQSLNWELDVTRLLRDYLQKTLSVLQKDWRDKRKIKRKNQISQKIKIDLDMWYSTLPAEIQPKIEKIVDCVEDSELSSEDQKDVVANVHDLIPEFPYYHWRHLHAEVRTASEDDYQSADYYRAFLEAAKRYINSVRAHSGSTNRSDQSMMGEVFGATATLSVTKKYTKPCGDQFPENTTRNIEDGQKWLSMGAVAGGRNPLSHEQISDLKDSRLFTEKDCLDLLSLLSHLYRRLGDSETR